MVDVLKFLTLVSLQKGLDRQCRPRSETVRTGSSVFVMTAQYGPMPMAYLPCLLFRQAFCEFQP